MSDASHRKYKDLVRQTTRHGKIVYYYRKLDGPRTRLPDEFGTQHFWDCYHAARNGVGSSWQRPRPVPKVARAEMLAKKALAKCLNGARHRAKAHGRDFDLTMEWLLQQLERQQMACALTGIQFFVAEKSGSKNHPYSPSLDRIDCTRGYTTDNVRIVLFAVNVMLMDWGEKVLDHVASRYRVFAAKQRKLALTQPKVRATDEATI